MNIRGLITLGIIILCIGSCFYYYISQPDCLRVKGLPAVYCSCDFKTHDEWVKWSESIKDNSDWEAVDFPRGYDPCKIHPVNDNSSSTVPNTKSQEELQNSVKEDDANIIKDSAKTDRSKTNIIVDSNIQIPLIKVHGGTFKMGSEVEGQNASPIHNVRLSNFYISKNLISQSLWQNVMNNNASNNSSSPVTNVSWDDVQTFINKLNKLTKKHYRLPTEAEWEYAARGGNESKGYTYSGTNDISQLHQRGISNELGIVDMTGVLWQWCSDYCNADFYKNCSEYEPKDLLTSNMRIKRGGGLANRPENCTVTFRHCLEPNQSDADIGFRLALN